MKRPNLTVLSSAKRSVRQGFSLIEVVLAIGVLALAVTSLLMMFGPTMKSVREVISANEATAATNAINEYLQQQAYSNFNNVASWLDPDPSDGFSGQAFYVYTSESSTITQTVVTDTASDITSALSAGELASGVLRVQLYELPSGFDYSQLNQEAVLPMLVEIYTVPNLQSPSSGGYKVFNYHSAVLR